MKTLPFNPDLFCKSRIPAMDEPFNYGGFEYYVRPEQSAYPWLDDEITLLMEAGVTR
jgi:hypothetical protein